MKNTLLLLCLFFMAAHTATAQCVRDSSILGTSALVSPPPYSTQNPVIATAPACINEPYNQSVTFNVPDTFNFQGIPFPISQVSIPASGGIANLPVGLSYSCDPPNCVFVANSLGCVLISGTPAASNTPGNFSLSFSITLVSPSLPFPITQQFPGTIAPGNEYIIQVRQTGQCSSGTNDLNSSINGLKNVPNPFSQYTTIVVDAKTSDNFQFEVFDLLGQRIHQQMVNLTEGRNEFTFDAGDLVNGTYYYSIGNQEGKSTRMMVLHR
jgi:hypothetical protein